MLLTWGWLFIVFFALWIAWEVYLFIKHIDYISAIHFTYLKITIPDESPETPKGMEQAFEVWGGIHKDPDVIERYFEGYFLAWYSCEIFCTRNKAQFILVIPTNHVRFFEGVIYGQYPTANIEETDDYALRYSFRDLEKTFDMYGTELILTDDEIYPIRTYLNYADVLAEDDKFVDPLQALLEAFTTIEEGEEFWFQLLVKPVSAKVIKSWAKKGENKMLEISGRAPKEKPSVVQEFFSYMASLPGEILGVLVGPAGETKEEEKVRPVFLNPGEQAVVQGILDKVSRSGFKTKIRVIHIAPPGKLHKPNISKAIGVFKQFSSFNLNGFKPDPDIKTNGPNYFFKASRRRVRKRNILLNYQWRDFWGDDSGFMMSAQELSTLYHFPTKYGRSPSIQRATAGLGTPPENLPFAWPVSGQAPWGFVEGRLS